MCLAQGDTTGGLYSFVNMFSGGALLQVSIFALGIMPYITASIITQLLRVVIPAFERLQKEGPEGQARLTQYTRSEEHTSELQSRGHLVCRLLLEKKKEIGCLVEYMQ